MVGYKKSINTLAALLVSGLVLGIWAGAARAQTATELDCTGCVRSKEIRNGSIRGVDLKNRTVDTKDLANRAVTRAKLANSARHATMPAMRCCRA